MADGNTISSSSLPLPQQQPTKLGSRSIDGKANKHGNVIQKTTSESMRLGSGGNNSDQQAGNPLLSSQLKNSTAGRNSKTSSFQITSVTTAIGIRTPADNGDDSADDLDESHTDDNSRITDHENETPSFSEDTFSKEDVFFSSHTIGSAPVIPTSAQYGLAIVAPNLSEPDGQMISDVHVSVTDGGLNIVGCSSKDVDLKDMNHRSERFKVVKIESTEPFKRGRWMCMDYLDHTTLQSTNPSSDGNTESNIDFENPNMDSPNKNVQTEIHLANVLNASLLTGQNASGGGYPLSTSTSPGQTLSQPINSSTVLNTAASIATEVTSNTSSHPTAVSLPNPIVQSLSSQQVSPISPQTSNVAPPSSTTNSQSCLQHQDSLVSGLNASLPPQQQQQIQSQSAQFHGPNSHTQQQQQQHHHHHHHHHHQGQTLPANVLHNITYSHANTSHVSTSAQPHQAMSMGHMSQSPQLVNQSNFTQSSPLQPIATIINNSPQSQQSVVMQTQLAAQQSVSSPVPQSQGSQPNYVSSAGSIVTGVSIPNSVNVNNSVSNVNNGNIGNGIGSAVNVNVDDGASGVSSGYLSPAGTAGTVPASISIGDVGQVNVIEGALIEGAAGSPPNQSTTTAAGTLNVISNTGATEDGAPTEDSESASGTSAVAIDNKIEQAMDLVKSHLMFAVREEVEVLKEKINELMDRINQLEFENAILKANATQETLAQLSTIAPPRPPQNPNPANGPVS